MRVLVPSVKGVTLEVRNDALLVLAIGEVPTGGWRDAQLHPHIAFVPPADGLLDLTFSVVPPDGPAIDVVSRIDAHIAVPLRPWLKGVRVRSSSNFIEAFITDAKTSLTTSGGDPQPWPWLV